MKILLCEDERDLSAAVKKILEINQYEVDCAFDGDLSTYFASSYSSGGWVGLDLSKTCVITRVGFAATPRGNGSELTLLGLIEGANLPDFSDALPLYLIKEAAPSGRLTYADVTVTRAFRYVRYVGPADARCNVAEIAFYGHAGEGDDSHFYQLTNLPTVSFHTTDNVEPYDKVNEITSHFTIIYADGTMEVVSDRDYTAEELVEKGVWQAFTFGPGLLEDGGITVGLHDEVGRAKASNPRTAIGIIDANHFVFVVSDGRTDESAGLTLYELAAFMQKLGVTTAYNLDGGGSSTMYFNGQVVNNPTSGGRIKERGVSDIVYSGYAAEM